MRYACGETERQTDMLIAVNIILHDYIPERKHGRELIPKTLMLNDKDFIIRMLYKDMY